MNSSLGLETLGNLSELLGSPVSNAPLEIPINDIIEDPDQPRKEFDPVTLSELAESIKSRGVKTPISVRLHSEGKYIINHGARRYRASKIAGKITIPAWIDNAYNDEDQVIENIQRDGLTPREIADYIGRKMAGGMRQIDIAKALGKSKTWVSQHASLLNLPEPIAEAFKTGRTTDVWLINELVGIHGKDASTVVKFLHSPSQEISRGTVRDLKEFVAKQQDQTAAANTNSGKFTDPNQAPPSTTLRKPTLRIEVDGKEGRLLYTKRPSKDGMVWVAFEDQEAEVSIDRIRLRALSGS